MGVPAKAKRKTRATADLAPLCPYCGGPATLTMGADIYQNKPKLAEKHFWICRPCDAWCGCRGATRKPLGFFANAELRRARMLLHKDVLDPLWEGAVAALVYEPEDEKARIIIRSTARSRVYGFLAFKLGIPRQECGTELFDIARCRLAYAILRDTDYAEVRAVMKAMKEPDDEKAKAHPPGGAA